MPRRARFAALQDSGPLILPSLLLCDFGSLADEIKSLEAAGVRALHLDIMDGHFVPNLSYGLTLVETIRRLTDLPLDAHLMISNPEAYIQRYYDAGADAITVHVESTDDPRQLLQTIRQTGAAAGIAINPPTPIRAIDDCIDCCDLILVMSVMPGFGGQKFDEAVLEKLRDLRPRIGREVILQIDGGVNPETIAACAAAGADGFVAGSAIFNHGDYAERLMVLTELATKR